MSEKNPSASDTTLPWQCIECGEKQVFPLATDYSVSIKYDGRPHEVRIADLEIPTCRKCGEQVFSGKEDDRIRAALRVLVGLLTPEQIRDQRKQLDLNQEEFADQLGVAKETISRWETGALMQSRAMDNLLRLYFECAEARALLARQFRPVQANRMKTERFSKIPRSMRENKPSFELFSSDPSRN